MHLHTHKTQEKPPRALLPQARRPYLIRRVLDAVSSQELSEVFAELLRPSLWLAELEGVVVKRQLRAHGGELVDLELGLLALHEVVRRHSRQEEGSRSEEHTSELQSLMRISYAVFCLKKKKSAHM